MTAGVNPVPRQNPYAPPRARVRDVAAPKAQLVLAERSTRLGAALVDGVIFALMVYTPFLIAMFASSATGSGTEPNGAVMMIGLVLTLVGFVAWTFLTLRQVSATGQSLAKKYFNIKVVLSDGSPVSLSTLIVKRNLLNGILGIIPLYGIVELLFIFSERRQCLHDKLADTIVVEA
ncbi:MAG TPA: RDD family protein [Vicinamibacterales bacterium]|nr:RDD family protein [Vicinamibacterales bacterium]